MSYRLGATGTGQAVICSRYFVMAGGPRITRITTDKKTNSQVLSVLIRVIRGLSSFLSRTRRVAIGSFGPYNGALVKLAGRQMGIPDLEVTRCEGQLLLWQS